MNPLSYYLDTRYLFNLHPQPLGSAGRIVLPTLMLGMLALGIFGRQYSGKLSDPIRRAGVRRISRPLLAMATMGILYTGAAWLGAPLLSTRVALLAWVLIAAVWLGAITWQELTTQPAKRSERERRRQIEKYLPR